MVWLCADWSLTRQFNGHLLTTGLPLPGLMACAKADSVDAGRCDVFGFRWSWCCMCGRLATTRAVRMELHYQLCILTTLPWLSRAYFEERPQNQFQHMNYSRPDREESKLSISMSRLAGVLTNCFPYLSRVLRGACRTILQHRQGHRGIFYSVRHRTFLPDNHSQKTTTSRRDVTRDSEKNRGLPQNP
jgi:hypothetical protein